MKTIVFALAIMASLHSVAQDGPGNSGNKITCTLSEGFVQNPIVVGPISSDQMFFLDYKDRIFMVDKTPSGEIRLIANTDDENANVIVARNELKYSTVIDGVSVQVVCSQE